MAAVSRGRARKGECDVSGRTTRSARSARNSRPSRQSGISRRSLLCVAPTRRSTFGPLLVRCGEQPAMIWFFETAYQVHGYPVVPSSGELAAGALIMVIDRLVKWIVQAISAV